MPTNFPNSKDAFVRPLGGGTPVGDPAAPDNSLAQPGREPLSVLIDNGYDAIEAIQERLLGEHINIKDKGAVPGADSSTAIQAAINEAAVGGRWVYVPEGTYIADASITPKSGVSLKGVRGKSIIKIKDGTQFNLFRAGVLADVTIEDLVLDLNKANTTNAGNDQEQNGVFIGLGSPAGDVTGVTLRRLHIKDGHQFGIRVNQASPTGARRLEVTIEDCDISGCKVGVRAIRGTKVRIINNTVHTNTAEGINCLGGHDDLVVLNHCYRNGGAGVVVNRQNPDDSRGARVIGNECNENGSDTPGNLGWGVNISDRVRSFTVAANVCRNNYQGGISVDVRAPVGDPERNNLQETNGSVTGNTVVGKSGVNASNGISCNYFKGLTVIGNVVEGQQVHGIQALGGRAMLAGNTLRNNGSNGINLGQPLDSPAGAGNHTVGPNVYEGNGGTLGGGLALTGGNTIHSGAPTQIPFANHAGAFVTWTDMPAAVVEFPGVGNRARTVAVLTAVTQARLVATMNVAGAAGAELRVQYSTDSGGAWNYLDGATGPSVTIDATGLRVGSWVALASGAKADVWLRVVGAGGDNAVDPQFGNVSLQVR